MGGWNILKKFGVWTTVLRWHEPFVYRCRLKGDVLVRLGIALAVGLAAAAALLFLFAVNNNPPPAAASLFGLLLIGAGAAVLLFQSGGNASGDVRLCEEGIVRTRQSHSFGHMRFEELSWPYEAIGQATIIPGESIGKSFSLLFVSSPGTWEMIGVPRRISAEQLASELATRGVEVRYADIVPEQFTRGMGWSGAVVSLLVALPIFAAGLIFYSTKAPLAPANIAAAPRPKPAPNFRPPRLPHRQPAMPDAVALRPQGPPKLPDAAVADVPELANPPPNAPEARAGPGGRAGPPNSRPPGMGPRSGPGAGQLPPSFAGRRGGPRSGGGRAQSKLAADNAQEIGVEKSADAPTADNRTADNQAAPKNGKKLAPASPRKTGPPQYNPPAWLPGQPTELAGGPEGFQFEHCDRGGKQVVGFRYRLGRWANQAAVADLAPLYDRNQFAQVKERVVAREGYVVGGVQVVSGDLVNAVRIIFVREQTDGALDKTDNYLSDWIGEPGGATPKALGDGQKRVIGVCGRRGAVLNALALVLDKE